MIASLHIENVAVVKRLDIEIPCGMTVLSGETGAGKSIIIDSLGLLLGAKADRELIEAGFTGDQIRIITENDGSVRYNVKFKLLEIISDIFS